jgi:hypothetical protein
LSTVVAWPTAPDNWLAVAAKEVVGMRDAELERIGVLVGDWKLTLTDSWFLESRDEEQRGRAIGRWLDEGFIELTAELNGVPTWHFVFGKNDADGGLVALYHDPRPASRKFDVTIDRDELTLLRRDPDFHQRFVAALTPDRIDGRWDASEDGGQTWRKDFDLVFERLGA